MEKNIFLYFASGAEKCGKERKTRNANCHTNQNHRRSPEFQGMPECVDDHSKGKIK